MVVFFGETKYVMYLLFFMNTDHLVKVNTTVVNRRQRL